MGDEKNRRRADSSLPFIARPLLALLIVAAPQMVPLIRRQILIAVPLFTEVFFVLRRKILPALIVALNILFLFGTETAPLITAIPCPARAGSSKIKQTPNNPIVRFNIPTALLLFEWIVCAHDPTLISLTVLVISWLYLAAVQRLEGA